MEQIMKVSCHEEMYGSSTDEKALSAKTAFHVNDSDRVTARKLLAFPQNRSLRSVGLRASRDCPLVLTG
jgi:hypothetical protein